MRILLSIHHELSADAGAPGATLRLADALKYLGHDVTLLSFDDLSGNPATKCYRFPWQLPRLITRRGDFDVLDLSSGDGWVFAAWNRMRGRRARPLIVARSHGLEHTVVNVTRHQAAIGHVKLSWKYPIYHGGYRLWECSQSFRDADLCLFLNEADRRHAVERLGVRTDRTALARNGIAQVFIEHALALAAQPTPSNACNIAFVGSHLPRKGIGVMRKAMVSVLQSYPTATLGYFGTGADAETVRSAYPQHLHPRITVTPRYGNAELPSLLQEYHILAFPSLSEGAALTPVEAMACGLVPVVSSAPGAHEHVVDGVSGIVVPVGDAAGLARAIGTLLDGPALWQSMRAAALSGSQSHAWLDIARSTVQLYAAFARLPETGGVPRTLALN